MWKTLHLFQCTINGTSGYKGLSILLIPNASYPYNIFRLDINLWVNILIPVYSYEPPSLCFMFLRKLTHYGGDRRRKLPWKTPVKEGHRKIRSIKSAPFLTTPNTMLIQTAVAKTAKVSDWRNSRHKNISASGSNLQNTSKPWIPRMSLDWKESWSKTTELGFLSRIR